MKQLAIGVAVLLIILSGCVSEPPRLKNAVEDTGFPVTLSDNHGRNITIETVPERIVSLAPSNTEILFALGLGEKVVGVTEYDDYPEEAKLKEKVGGFQTVDIEKVASLNPELVLATGGVQLEVVEKLREIGLTVVVIDANGISEIQENILLIGRIAGSKREAESLVDSMGQRIEAVKDKSSSNLRRPRVMYIVWGEPLMAAGPGAFASNLIELAGGENVFSDSGIDYPKVSMESVIERDPEVIITNTNTEMELESLKDAAEWKGISAVKNDRFHVINGDIVSRPGPRIVDALELFSTWIAEEP